MSKTFFEYLGIADMERIHSQILAWIFSSDFRGITEKQKITLLEKTFGLANVSSIEKILTETYRIDILIETDRELIVIENKIKSSQHSDQLARYVEHFKKTHKIQPKFYFLTLVEEKVKDSNWKRISYQHIYECLSSLELLDNPQSVIFKEYRSYLAKLTSLLMEFQMNASKYDMVFLDGKKRKEDKVNFVYRNDNERFIADNQLETILQKSFLNSLSQRILNVESRVMDTRGDALIDFYLKVDIPFNKKKYTTMIELQGDIIKFAFVISGFSEYNNSKKDWIKDIVPIMEQLVKTNPFNYTKCNKPKRKAYISISKKLEQKYWHMQPEDLVALVEKEIQNGYKLTESLQLQLN
ncbi:hypothetical protein AAFH68_16660 [Flavobacterium sp. CGRL1]